jgi:uncharacterized phage infection (PIP) family protein YhgE
MKQIAIAAMLFAATNALCQSPPKEIDTLRSLMAEVHQLRIDIEAMTVASQRVQIALYKLQSQDAAVARAAQRADGLHDRCMRAEDARQHTTASVQRIDNALSSGSLQESQTKNLQSQLAELKGMLDTQTAESQSCQAAEAEASGQLQKEQGKLAEVQDRVDRLDSTLQKAGRLPQ